VSGDLKAQAGKVKLQAVRPIETGAIPSGDPERRLLDAGHRSQANPKTWEKIRHQLAMMPYVSEFDFISFTLTGSEFILTGWTVRAANRDEAYDQVKDVEGVETVINNIDILPLGRNDMEIRAGARLVLQRVLSRYFWASGSDIKIVVKNGQIILLGTVTRKADSDLAYIQCNSVPNAFKVFNMLQVKSSVKKTDQAAQLGPPGRRPL
jgi:osmotically-inducible protein OsmY